MSTFFSNSPSLMPSSSLVASVDHIDALPYVDSLYQGKMKADVDQLIREEMARESGKSLEDFLADLPSSSFVLQAVDPISIERYSVPEPAVNMKKNINAWKEAISNAEAQMEHQNIRLANLELMNVHSGKAWVAYTEKLKTNKNQLVHILEQCKVEKDLINQQRKEKQVNAKEKLDRLEREWYSLVEKNRELDFVCTHMEAQLPVEEEKEDLMDE